MSILKKAFIGLGIAKPDPPRDLFALSSDGSMLLLNLIIERLDLLVDMRRAELKLKPLQVAQKEDDEQWIKKVLASG